MAESGVQETQPSPPHSSPADAAACEFVPKDYFRRLEAGEVFHNERALEVDLGCGDGSFLVAMAQLHPDRNFLGVERLLGRARKVSRRASRLGLDNIKVLRLEAKYTVEWLLGPHSAQRIHLLFPDPWPKARHHKRRLVQQPFLAAVATVLVPGGEFLFKTDDADYYEWALEELEAFPGLDRKDWSEEDFPYAETDFERQWKAEGRDVYFLRGVSPA